jgi:hypothetical protein
MRPEATGPEGARGPRPGGGIVGVADSAEAEGARGPGRGEPEARPRDATPTGVTIGTFGKRRFSA